MGRRLIAGTATVGLAGSILAGCGRGHEGPTPSPSNGAVIIGTARCRAYGEWDRTDSKLNMTVIAQRLGTTATAVQNGFMGGVHCNPGFNGREITAGPIATVSGLPEIAHLGNTCMMVITTGVTAPPDAAHTYPDFTAVCPAE